MPIISNHHVQALCPLQEWCNLKHHLMLAGANHRTIKKLSQIFIVFFVLCFEIQKGGSSIINQNPTLPNFKAMYEEHAVYRDDFFHIQVSMKQIFLDEERMQWQLEGGSNGGNRFGR